MADLDYDSISESYDDHRRGGGPYLDTLVDLARSADATTVLEIGAGTGNNTASLRDAYPCTLLALERSPGMLAKGRAKVADVHWINGDAARLPVADDSIDFIFGVLVLHHFADLASLLRECSRVIKSGYAAFVTSPHSFIKSHPMNRYFPSFAPIDLGRFQEVETIRKAFMNWGFTETGTEHCTANPEAIDAIYVEKVRNKFISTYRLMAQDEFERGLSRLERDVVAKGRLDEDMVWQAITVWGRK